MEDSTSKPLSRTYGIPASRSGSVKNNESEILLLKKRIRILEERFQGYVYTETAATIDIINTSEWVDLPYTGTLDDTSVGLEALTGKLGLKNISSKNYLVRVQATFDGVSLGPNEEMALRLVLNGTKINGAECHATGTANGVIAKLNSYALVWMEPNDEIWMQAANFTNSGDIDFERGKMVIYRLAGVN